MNGNASGRSFETYVTETFCRASGGRAERKSKRDAMITCSMAIQQ
jgi:hypothetical protein